MLSSKANAEWLWDLFLPMFLLVLGVLLAIVVLQPYFKQPICTLEQREEIEKVNDKIEEMIRVQGTEIIKFEIEDCVESLNYEPGEFRINNKLFTGNVTVKYKTAEKPINYPTQLVWNLGGEKGPGPYKLRVSYEGVECVGVWSS